MFQRFQVTSVESFFFPTKFLKQYLVLTSQCNITNGTAVGIDSNGDSGIIEGVNVVILYPGKDISLDVAGRTDFEVYIVIF